jgi:putative redox protein
MSWLEVSGPSTGFAQTITVGAHHLTGDEPKDVGGTDTGPSPYDYLLAALGTCTSMTLSLFARRHQWPLESVTVRLHHEKVDGKDRIERHLTLVGPVSEAQRQTLLAIADKCPIHRTLMSDLDIVTQLT